MTEREAVERIGHDLRNLGTRTGGILMVHSSLRSLGPVPGGAETVVRGLLAAIGETGTLLMPALSYLQRPHHVHSTLDTPSNVGALPEYFRRRPGTLRSVHPTHSACAVGPAARELLGDHHLDRTPCGPNSPFRKMIARGARIVMLGCGLAPNTTMHALEEQVEPPYLFGPDCRYTITDGHGRTTTETYRRHGFDGWEQRYARVALLDEPGLLRSGPVLEAHAFVLDARLLERAVLAGLAEDPLYFVAESRSGSPPPAGAVPDR